MDPTPSAARQWRLASNHEITISYINGGLTGNSGCNQFSAGTSHGVDVTGDVNDRDSFRITPLATTRRACPEPKAGNEAQFLRRIQAAFAIHTGSEQISIDYKIGEDAGTLNFEPVP